MNYSVPKSATAPAAIELAGLTKKYGELTAVSELSLRVPEGVLFGFLGPNGAGKSTTIGCMTGLLEPTGGTVSLLGQRFTADSYHVKRRIGVMPEGLALFEQLRAGEFLQFQGRIFGLDAATARKRAAELLEVFDLESSHHQRLAEFSTGMRKKVAFSAAVIHSPEILFLDEPFESIDPSAVAMLKEWLRNYVREGRTVFMTSHVLETVEKLCDQVAIIKAGELAWNSAIGHGTAFEYQGQRFESLEALFLHIAGHQERKLDWL
jgi:ABC-2 type transport system ATP-binding protein